MKSLIEILENTARKKPLKEMIVSPEERLMYFQVINRVRRLAGILAHDFHVEDGDRVLIQLKNSSQFIVSYFAVLEVGAVPVPLGIFLSKNEVSYIMKDSEPVLALSVEEFLDKLEGAKIESGQEQVRLLSMDEAGQYDNVKKYLKHVRPYYRKNKDDFEKIAVIIYTSGTTGYPKGVMLTHGNLLANLKASVERIPFQASDHVLGFLPFYHSFAFTVCVLIPIYVGATIYIRPSVIPLQKFMWWAVNNGITMFPGVPKVFYLLARSKIPLWFRLFNRIRMCISGAAPLDENTLQNFEKTLRIPLLEGYGLSEASPVVSANPLMGVRKALSVGPSLEGVDVKIIDKDERELSVGSVGELIVKGPNVMKGYYKKEEETKEAIKNGWLFTGDIARIDEEGYIFIVDRKKDLIIVNGLNVYPREVEVVLESYPKVKEAAVIKGMTTTFSEYPIAVLVIQEGAETSVDELNCFCQERLSPYKVPRRYYFCDSFPKTPTGKTLKREIKIEEMEAAK
ncbi:AMP-binding protein [PVC group bacterium]|nr:AMP-binding protein [PVC group bacterium]